MSVPRLSRRGLLAGLGSALFLALELRHVRRLGVRASTVAFPVAGVFVLGPFAFMGWSALRLYDSMDELSAWLM